MFVPPLPQQTDTHTHTSCTPRRFSLSPVTFQTLSTSKREREREREREDARWIHGIRDIQWYIGKICGCCYCTCRDSLEETHVERFRYDVDEFRRYVVSSLQNVRSKKTILFLMSDTQSGVFYSLSCSLSISIST